MDQLYKQVLSFQHRVNDWLDEPSHPIGQSLKKQVQRFEDQVQVKTNPRTLEGTVNGIHGLLKQAGDNKVMSSHHAVELMNQCEDFIKTLRSLR